MGELGAFATDTGDRAFMEALYGRFGKLMVSTARKYLPEEAEVEDAVQTALLGLLGRAELLRGMDDGPLAGYVRSSVRNAALNILREREMGERRKERLQASGEETLSMDELMILYERRAALRTVLEQLRPVDRLLLEGKYLLHYTDGELAAQLSCQAGSVRMKLTRARRRALELLKEREVEGNEGP